MSIKIIVEGETPIAALADLAVAARYLAQSPEVTAAANNVMDVDKSDVKPIDQREKPPVTVDVGPRPTYMAPAPGNASAPGNVPAPGQNASSASVTPNAAFTPQSGPAVGGYPGNGSAQNSAQQGAYGYGGYPPANGAAQNPLPVGAPGVTQGNPTAGRTGQPTTMTQTSLFNGQPAANPGAGPIPVSAAPGFTVEQIGKAGADLVTANPAKRNELNALLQRYGVQSVSELGPEHLGTFAQALRGMGANI